jgi:hypothetical protein
MYLGVWLLTEYGLVNWIYLNTYTHDSELQGITALSLISILYKSLAHAKSSQFTFSSRFIVTDPNSGDSPGSVLTSLLSGEYPATELPTTDNSTRAPSLFSLPWRAQLNCQTSTNWIPGWRSFHTKLLISSQVDFQLTTDNWTGQIKCLEDNSSARATSKTPFFYCCASVRFRWNVFTEPLLRNGLHNPVVLLLRACMLRALPNNGRCLQTHRLATGLYVTLYTYIYVAILG